ncbi:hypothetical protein NA78x_001281 [Anatilimnocola sp. NA78]|uniref:hypothetical protein n=1 Tax=Anatilimnocola sp. NA78 TaxID=3415683 RepID=UPI003CE55F62
MTTWVIVASLAMIGSSAASLLAQVADPAAESAVAEIESLGGRVYRRPDGQVDIVSLRGDKVGDEELDLLQFLPTARVLDLDGSRVTNAGLDRLLKAPQLEEVSLRGTAVTRAAAEDFKERHPGVYRVTVSAGFKPAMFVFAASMLIPIGCGCWLIWITHRKREVLQPWLYYRGMLWGLLLIAFFALVMFVAVLQAIGIEFRIADLFG